MQFYGDRQIDTRIYMEKINLHEQLGKYSERKALTTWVDLENIVLSKISQMEKSRTKDFTYTKDIKLKAINEPTRQTNKN